MAVFIPVFNILQKNNPVILARFAGPGGAPIHVADVSTIHFQVHRIYSADNATLMAASEELLPDDVIFNTLVFDDPMWDSFDLIGYNFKHTIENGDVLFPFAGNYQLDYKFVLADLSIPYYASIQLKTTRMFFE